MFVIGVTGGIGSGKTTVSNIFQSLGVPVYNADLRAKYLMNSDVDLRKKIIQLFGGQAYKDNELHREYIAQIVFSDKNKLHQLERVVHPAVRKDFKKWLARQNALYVVLENAILHKSGMSELVDYVILVTSDVEKRVKRVKKRDDLSENQIKNRINNQEKDEILLKKSDFVLENNETIDVLAKNIENIDSNLKILLKKS